MQHAGVSGPPRVQLGARAAAGMLHRLARMEGAEERRHGGFTGLPRAQPARARGAGGKRQQRHRKPGEERRENREHGVLQ